ncbi:hypothetical protein QFC20_006179 [Naganishia adeliensis]|uniref:Uncharacterized protein n=1 Tax=Naganishia adeliensis TaxID=92952 RepID=A0ACC2VDX1_9TREE|nr:hypothetical protein QFC20_006179 [Naganishia adeliensis]
MSSISTTTTSPLQRTSPGDELLLSNAPQPDDGLPDLEDYPRKNAKWEEQEDERLLDRTEDAVLIPTRQGTSLGDEMLMSDPPMPSHGPPYLNRYLRKIAEWKEREDERLLDRQEEAELRPRTTSEERKAAQFEKQAAEKAKQEAKAKNELPEKDKRLEGSFYAPILTFCVQNRASAMHADVLYGRIVVKPAPSPPKVARRRFPAGAYEVHEN